MINNMNKKQKGSIILASLASIAVAGSLIAGATYALFTSESSDNIAVTNGKVDVKASINNFYVYSPTLISMEEGNEVLDKNNAATNDEDNKIYKFANGGTASIDGNTVTVSNMTPGDYVEFSIGVTNYSNVKAQYRTVYTISDDSDDDLVEALKISTDRILINNSTGWEFLSAASDSESGDLITSEDSYWGIQLPTTASNSLQGKSCTISFTVEAVQGNAKTFFYGGDGTIDNPFIIKDAESFSKMAYYSDRYKYYEIAEDVTEIDCSGISAINFLGSINGNNVPIKSNKFIFYTIGYYSQKSHSVVRNFDVTLNSASPFVYSVVETETTFDNVNIHGVIEIAQNVSAFVQYGPACFRGYFNYVLNFKNCSCDASIKATVANSAAVLVGHTYPGTGYSATYYIDSATDEGIENAKIYAMPSGSSSAKGYKYYSTSSAKVYKDGVLLDASANSMPATTIQTLKPSKGESSYTVEKDENATKFVVKVETALTAYDDDGNVMSNYNGITNVCIPYKDIDVSGLSGSIDIFDLFTSVEIVNKSSGQGYPAWSLDSESKKLTITTNSTVNYQTGTISLTVVQYDSNGLLLSSGGLVIAKSTGTPNQGEVTWSVI